MKQMNKNLLDEITDIEVLKDGCRSLNKLIMIKESKLDQQQQKIERLNNIINELEKWLKEEIERLMTIEQSNNVIFLIGAYTEVLDKLQELKRK